MRSNPSSFNSLLGHLRANLTSSGRRTSNSFLVFTATRGQRERRRARADPFVSFSLLSPSGNSRISFKLTRGPFYPLRLPSYRLSAEHERWFLITGKTRRVSRRRSEPRFASVSSNKRWRRLTVPVGLRSWRSVSPSRKLVYIFFPPSYLSFVLPACSPAPGHHQMSSFPSSRLNALPSSPSLSGSPSLQQHQSTPIRPSGTLSRNPSSTSTPTPLQNSFLPGSDSPSNSTDRGTPQQATTTTTPAAGLSWEDLEGVRNQVESLRMLIQGQERRLVRREGESVERIRRVSLDASFLLISCKEEGADRSAPPFFDSRECRLRKNRRDGEELVGNWLRRFERDGRRKGRT